MTPARPLAIVLSLSFAAAPAAEPAFPAADVEFFEKAVRPVLVARCVECHGPKKQSGNLRLDHRDFAVKGGDSGPAVAPGKPADSLLVEAVNYGSFEMPPTGRLKPEEVAVLTKWVELGAPWPAETAAKAADAGGFDLEARKAHWSFQPIRPVPPPAVKDESWPADDVDRFVLAMLEAAGLKPAADADRRTLLRRAYFDVIGLPPTPEQTAAFLADESPEAFERVVDGLLASPHFGERWGRHWLDLVRYADTLGHEFDYPLPHAWRYRDYVVRAINADVPYDAFVREHVAGDLLATPRRNLADGTDESVIATGFWHLHDDVHAPVDVRQAEALRYENQIDVFGKAFLGLTVACARCHDHKFDPITAADYYALAGFLKGSRRGETALDPHGRTAEIAAKIEALRDAADALAGPSDPPAAPAPRDGEVVFETFNGDSYDGWFAAGPAFGRRPVRGVADSGRLAKNLTGTLRSRDFTIERGAVLVRLAAEKARVRLVVDGYQMDQLQPLLFAGLTQSVDTGGEWRWVRIAGDLPNYKGHRAYLEFLDDADGRIAIDEVRFTDRGDEPPAAARDPLPPREPPDLSRRDEPAGSPAAEIARLTAEADAFAATIPHSARVLAMTDGPGCNEELFIRGNHENTSGPVPRRFLEAIAGPDQPPPGPGCGRLELADRLLADSDPFPARVMANRVWRHLFGEGIVPTVDNFGVLGEAPSHPELLDHLAGGFRKDGWSVKRLIRRLMLSRAYRMESTPNPETAGKIADVDPANRLLHAQRVRRLEGEALRDAILAVSGRLDPAVGGEPVPIHLTEFLQGRGRPGRSGPLDGDGRRSLYLSVRRNFLVPMLTAFDFPPPATCVGRRNESNVPAQALILLNDPFVLAEATRWAARALADGSPTPEARLAALYRTAYARDPTPAETALTLDFLQADAAPRPADWRTDPQAWSALCHVLLNGKEFVFVR